MSYPTPNPYDPNQQQPGYGPPSQPPHFTTDADPYSRPDPYGQPSYGQPGYQANPPMSVAPGSVPPGGTPPPGQYPGQAFQPGQPAPPPPGGSSNTPLIATLVIVVAVIAAGAIFVGMTLTGGDEEEDDPVVAEESSDDPSPSDEVTSESPSPEETTADSDEAVYRLPVEDECIENSDEGFYVVPCDAETAYWLVIHVEQSPDDPDPEDEWHSVAASNACDGYDWTQYYFTDTAVSAGREWDPEIDSITAIYCVREVE